MFNEKSILFENKLIRIVDEVIKDVKDIKEKATKI